MALALSGTTSPQSRRDLTTISPRQINSEDISICENVQLGTQAPAYQGGRFSFRFEEPLHRFQNMIVDKMVANPATRYRIPAGDNEEGGYCTSWEDEPASEEPAAASMAAAM